MRELYHYLKKRYYKRRCYWSIEDLPVVIWFKLHEGGELNLLWKRESSRKPKYLDTIFTQIYDEYISRIGLTHEYLHYLEQLRGIGLMNCNCVIKPTPILKLNLKIQQEKLNKVHTLGGSTYTDILAQVSKKQGYSVWNVSVLEFYAYLKVNGKK